MAAGLAPLPPARQCGSTAGVLGPWARWDTVRSSIWTIVWCTRRRRTAPARRRRGARDLPPPAALPPKSSKCEFGRQSYSSSPQRQPGWARRRARACSSCSATRRAATTRGARGPELLTRPGLNTLMMPAVTDGSSSMLRLVKDDDDPRIPALLEINKPYACHSGTAWPGPVSLGSPVARIVIRVTRDHVHNQARIMSAT